MKILGSLGTLSFPPMLAASLFSVMLTALPAAHAQSNTSKAPAATVLPTVPVSVTNMPAVTVANTPSVTLAGSPTVTIATTGPIATTPGKLTPYSGSCSTQLTVPNYPPFPIPAVCALPPIPVGMLLVIQEFDFSSVVPAPAFSAGLPYGFFSPATLTTTLNDLQTSHVFPLSHDSVPSVHQATTMYSEIPPTCLLAAYTYPQPNQPAPSSVTFNYSCAVSGYLVSK